MKPEPYSRPTGALTLGLRASGQQQLALAIRATAIAVGWDVDDQGNYILYPM